MGRGRFRLRTIMLVIAGLAILLSFVAAYERHLQRSRVVTVTIINRKSAPLTDIRVVYPDGEHKIPRVSPGEVAEFRFLTSTDVTVRVESQGRGATFGGVRGGSHPTITYSD
jgi:hypothetical protein